METRSILRGFGLTAAACLALLCIAFAPARADTVLSPGGPSSAADECPDTAGPCYEPNTSVAFARAAVGQTITVPTNGDTDLVSFGIGVYTPDLLVAGVGMVAEVYAWDGSHPTGSSLYASPLTPLDSEDDLVYNYQTVSPIFDTGGLKLKAGGQYIIFVSIEQAFYIGTLVSGTPYSGGESVLVNTGHEPSPWTTETWFSLGAAYAADWYGPGKNPPNPTQFQFIATFAAVPEPRTWILTLAGFACLGLIGLAARRGARFA